MPPQPNQRPRGLNVILDEMEDTALHKQQARFRQVTDAQSRQNLADLANAALGIRLGPGGGLYGDFGLGLGGGFNLHFDRDGIQPSVGGGIYGRASIGYAGNRADLESARGRSRAFGGARVGPADLSAEITRDGVQASAGVGPVEGAIGYDWQRKRPSVGGGLSYGLGERQTRKGVRFSDPSVDVARSPGSPIEVGFGGGIGILKNLPFYRWGGR